MGIADSVLGDGNDEISAGEGSSDGDDGAGADCFGASITNPKHTSPLIGRGGAALVAGWLEKGQ